MKTYILNLPECELRNFLLDHKADILQIMQLAWKFNCSGVVLEYENIIYKQP